MSDHSFDLSIFNVPPRRLTPRVSLWTRLGMMLSARRTRRILGEMDDRMLADIGVGHGDALIEANRPAWDLGPTRR